MWEQRLLTLAREATRTHRRSVDPSGDLPHARAKQKMQEITAEYEKLADRLERAAAET